MALSAEIRSRFGNDPQNLILFLEDPSNRPEAEKLGLVNSSAIPPERAHNAGAGGWLRLRRSLPLSLLRRPRGFIPRGHSPPS